MNVNPGELNKRIRIVLPVKTEDADGYYSTEYRSIRECWAKFTRSSGTELIKANADLAEVNARFLIRYTRARINRKMEVQYDGASYQIEYVNNYGDGREYIEIWARLLTQEADI